MKRPMSCILCAFVLFATATVGWANSGPVYWQGYPSTGIMAVQSNSPIKVEREDLVFDFTDYDGSHYTVSGRVTATYQMVNPTQQAQSVQMAFPFVGSIGNLSYDDTRITVDDETWPYELYVGDGNTHFEFDKIINTIRDKPYRAKNFEENETGRLYTIDVQPTTDQEINFAVDFELDSEQTKAITSGFNRLERDGSNTRIASWCRKPETLEIFVLGKDINFGISAYTDGQLSQETGLFKYRITEQGMGLKPYLMEYAKKHIDTKGSSFIPAARLYNLYAQALDNHFTRHTGLCSEHDLMAQRAQKRMIVLVYKVDFPAESQKKVSVSYTTAGTMDSRKTAQPLYYFEYILNPAKNWAGFKDLNIEIIPPTAAPYVVESSVDLIREQNGIYSTALERLPEEDLFFSLYSHDKITLLDRIMGSIQRKFRYLTPLVLGAILFIMVGMLVVIVIKRKKELLR